MTETEPVVRAFTPADWNAVCDLYESAARLELTLTGTDPRAFRPMPVEEDLDTLSGSVLLPAGTRSPLACDVVVQAGRRCRWSINDRRRGVVAG